jgi:predicted nucleotide-binding protein (sugar kinase/HSP70/actin superfamily)
MRDETLALDTVRVCEMTKHFERRLRERLGIELTIERLNQLLSESKRIRRQQSIYRLINGVYRHRLVVGEFWHHAAGIIMLIDEWKGKAITVVTPRDVLPIRPKAPHVEKITRRR